MQFWSTERHGAVEVATYSNPLLPPLAVANAKRALYEGADADLHAAFEIENMNCTEVLQSDDAKVALSTFLAIDPASRRDFFESTSSESYPAYSGH